MSTIRLIIARLRGLFRQHDGDAELDEEIRFHIEREAESNRAAGMSPAEAERRARVAFGGMQAVKEAHRDGRSIRWIRELVTDVRHAMRGFARRPLLGGAAVLTLAIAIGANTAIYSAVSAVILRPLPFADPSRLVMLWEENAERGWHLNVAAPANVLDWKEQVAAFKDVAAYSPYVNSVTLTGVGEPQVLNNYSVTGNFFSVLGIPAALGRGFVDAESWTTGTPVAVISDRMWRSTFNADPRAVGRTVQLDGANIQIVGVMPRAFRVPGMDADIWTPVAWRPASRTLTFFRRAHFLRPIARIKPNVTATEANSQLQLVVKRLQHDYPTLNASMGAGMTPLQEFLVGNTRRPLMVLLAAVGLLLLIACANVGNLLLVQTAGRAREAALRLALGARRTRLLRQALTESMVLSVLGGGAGLLLGWIGTRVLVTMQPAGMLPVENIGVNWSVVLYVIAITTLSGILFGIAPVLWNSQRMPGEVLKQGSRGSGISGAMQRWANALVVGEIAFALLLSLGATLLLRSFAQLQQVDPGFDPSGVLAITMSIPDARYDSAATVNLFYSQLLERTRALPGVQSAALSSTLPLSGGVGWTSDFSVAGRAADRFGTEVAHRSASADYYTTMRTPLLRGRTFTANDALDAPNVVLINESMARAYFSGENPVGQRITFDRTPDSASTWRTIVGVVGDERQVDLGTPPQIEFITPQLQSPSTFANLVVRVTDAPASLVGPIRRVVKDFDASVGFTSVQTMDDLRRSSLARQRFLMTLLSGFAVAGLLLAVIGVYGVMANLARRRSREMGIRVALGAQAGAVQWLVIREGLRLTTLGIAIGVSGAVAASRVMISMLYHVRPVDPVTFVFVPLLLAAVATMATWLPASRASQADPMETLRLE